MKHCIKLCTKIQIYYSYCIPFSTDFFFSSFVFFQFSRQQRSQAGETRALPGPGAGAPARPAPGRRPPEGCGCHRRDADATRGMRLPPEGRRCRQASHRPLAEGVPAPTPSWVTLVAGGCFGTAPSLTTTPQSDLPAPTSPGRVVVPEGPLLRLQQPPHAVTLPRCLQTGSSSSAKGCPSQGHSPSLLPVPGLAPLPGFAQPCQGPRELPGELGALPCPGPCKQPPDTCTETWPVLRTLLRCWPTRTGPAGRAAAVPGCPVCAMGPGRAQGLLGSAAATSPRAIAAWQRGADRGHGHGARVPRAMCSRESLAVTSGDKAPYGEGREGVWQQPAAGSGRGWWGLLLCPPGGVCMFSCSHLPGFTFSSSASRVSQRPAAARPPRSPRWGQPAAAAATHQEHRVPGRGTRGLESLYPV